MRIQHNLSAMNALSNYAGNNSALSSSLEKLSSGYRINSAADDAAGLAISEKMRSQIAGLEKAQDNANDGISLVQTAEGALTEVNSMLTRLTELATQSANGTYEDGVDRTNIQEETDAILDEIDRISQSTNFNGINLLDGSLSGKSQVSNLALDTSNAVAGVYDLGVALKDSSAFSSLDVDDIGKSIDYTVTWQTGDGTEKTTTVSLTYQGDGTGVVDGTTPTNNYFTDDLGNKYYVDDGTGTAATSGNTLAASGLSADQIQEAVIAGLKSDDEFNAAFSITKTTTTDAAGLTEPSLEFTARTAGTSGASVISTGAKSNLSVDYTSGSDAVVATKALNAMQKFDLSKIQVATGSDDGAAIASKVFEIDGHKFLAVDKTTNNDPFTDVQRKALADDINVIEVETTAATGAVGNTPAAATISANGTGTAGGAGATVAVTGTGTAADALAAGTSVTLTYDATSTPPAWKTGGADVNLSDYGLTLTGTAAHNDQIVFTAATPAQPAKASGVDATQSASTIAAEISRVTGLKADVSDGTEPAASGINQYDIFFSEDTLKVKGTDLSLQVGDTNASYQKVNVKIQDMSSAGLGLTGLDLSNQESAGNAIDTIKNAVNAVSLQRGQLGATQNRLDHTLNNLDATTQNITAAESQIRDVDMAKEMTEYSKNNILVQAAQSMLAQANSLPQGVLQLLG